MSVYCDVCKMSEVEGKERKGRFTGDGMRTNKRFRRLNVCANVVTHGGVECSSQGHFFIMYD